MSKSEQLKMILSKVIDNVLTMLSFTGCVAALALLFLVALD